MVKIGRSCDLLHKFWTTVQSAGKLPAQESNFNRLVQAKVFGLELRAQFISLNQFQEQVVGKLEFGFSGITGSEPANWSEFRCLQDDWQRI